MADTLFIQHGEAPRASLLGPECEGGRREHVLPLSSPSNLQHPCTGWGYVDHWLLPASLLPSCRKLLRRSPSTFLDVPSSCLLQGAQLYHLSIPPNPAPSLPESRHLAQGLPPHSALLSSQDDYCRPLRPAGPQPCPLRLFSSGQVGHAGRALS